ncbi:hypothetical protein [Aurantibacter sp.]|uniref:hypothetical protein n=1 Tax=Aurantibacter sp. TaxID=2807103 RepID=UPI003264BBCC
MNRNIVFILLLTVLTSCNFKNNQSAARPIDDKNKITSPIALMKKMQIALHNKDSNTIANFLIKDSTRTPTMAKALAELIIELKNGSYYQFREQNIKIFKNLDFKLPTGTARIMFDIGMLPSFSTFAENGIYIKDKNKLTYHFSNEKSETTFSINHEMEIKITDDGIKFWPVGIQQSKAIIYTNQIINNLESAITSTSKKFKQQENLDNLIKSAVGETSLTYKKSPANGKIEGRNWKFHSGKAEKGWFAGKYKYLIQLTNLEVENDCEKNINNDYYQLQLRNAGDYNLAYSDCILTIYKKQKDTKETTINTQTIIDGKVSIEIDNNNKFITGKIAGKLDDNNYINGTFTIPICDN